MLSDTALFGMLRSERNVNLKPCPVVVRSPSCFSTKKHYPQHPNQILIGIKYTLYIYIASITVTKYTILYYFCRLAMFCPRAAAFHFGGNYTSEGWAKSHNKTYIRKI